MENNPSTTQRSNISSEGNKNFEFKSDWETLSSKIEALLGTKNLFSSKVNQHKNPSLLIIGFLVIPIALKAYSSTLSNIGEIPFASSVFEVIGTFWLIRFSMTRLLRKKDRQHYVSEVKSRLKAFLGHEEEKQ